MKHIAVSVIAAVTLAGCSIATPEPFSRLNQVENESVVLLHGLARGASNMRQIKARIEAQGYSVCSIDYATIGRSLEQVKLQTTEQIDHCLEGKERVHFVGHSLGGLVIRSYLNDHPDVPEQARFGKVVTLGTPHHGSEVADEFDGGVLIKVAGGVSQSLVTGSESFGNQLPAPTYPLGAIAGLEGIMPTDSVFEGTNDGLVSIQSSQVEGMQDFIALNVNHLDMPYDSHVAYQTMHFLQLGRFDHYSAH